MRNINKAGLAMIKRCEGLRLNAYLCPAKVWTIGYGHTGPEVKAGQTITEAKAEALLKEDLYRFEVAVEQAVTVPLTDNQFAACVSLAFNIGAEAFATSTLVRRLNAKDYAGAADQFPRWNKAAGRVLPGLVQGMFSILGILNLSNGGHGVDHHTDENIEDNKGGEHDKR